MCLCARERLLTACRSVCSSAYVSPNCWSAYLPRYLICLSAIYLHLLNVVLVLVCPSSVCVWCLLPFLLLCDQSAAKCSICVGVCFLSHCCSLPNLAFRNMWSDGNICIFISVTPAMPGRKEERGELCVPTTVTSSANSCFVKM